MYLHQPSFHSHCLLYLVLYLVGFKENGAAISTCYLNWCVREIATKYDINKPRSLLCSRTRVKAIRSQLDNPPRPHTSQAGVFGEAAKLPTAVV